jgi:hypothetical protein
MPSEREFYRPTWSNLLDTSGTRARPRIYRVGRRSVTQYGGSAVHARTLVRDSIAVPYQVHLELASGYVRPHIKVLASRRRDRGVVNGRCR